MKENRVFSLTKGFKEYIGIVVSIVLFISLFIIGIVINKMVLIAVSSFMILFIIVLIIFLRFYDPFKDMKKLENRIDNKKKELIEKKNKTAFEKLYIMTCNNQIDNFLNEYLKNKQDKRIKTINIETNTEDSLLFSCGYIGFDIDLIVKNDEIKLCIDSPSKYDGIKENEELENKKIIKINQEYNLSKKLFIDYLIEIINQSVNTIDVFVSNNNVDSIINGRIIGKLKLIRHYFKSEGYEYVICSPILIAFSILGIWYGIYDNIYSDGKILSFIVLLICCIFFIIISIIFFINGIEYLYRYHKMKSDISKKVVLEIEDSPIKMRLIIRKPTKYSTTRDIRYMKLYFKNGLKLIVPFDQVIFFNSKINLKELYKECLEFKCVKLKYLEKSKVVILGADKYVKKVKKACNKSNQKNGHNKNWLFN